MKYGYDDIGTMIQPIDGWKLVPEFATVPDVHREYIQHVGWMRPTRYDSSKASTRARAWGGVRAYAVPADEEFNLDHALLVGAEVVIEKAGTNDAKLVWDYMDWYKKCHTQNDVLGMMLYKKWLGRCMQMVRTAIAKGEYKDDAIKTHT